jgi:hypothetical protein
VLQLQKDRPLRPQLPCSEARQLPTSSGTRAESTAGPAPRSGHANYTTMDRIPTGEDVFDSGASHDFISSACAKKAKLSIVATEASYVINTLGGRVDEDQVVRKVPLKLVSHVFSTNLIILSG